MEYAQPGLSATLPRPFRFRLNYIDHYQARPTVFDPVLRPTGGADASMKVPVMRVFGATEAGQRVCVHVHGVLPYLFIPAAERVCQDRADRGEYVRYVHEAVENALVKTLRPRQPTRHVALVELVKGIPFYGFHVGYRLFVKISVLKPFYVSRLAALLIAGDVFPGGGSVQPHESHMQYQLQWMCDYNLYGCAFTDCSVAAFRQPVPEEEDGHPLRWDSRSIPTRLILPEQSLDRLSTCELEVDVCAWHIMNRQAIQARNLHHHFADRLGLSVVNDDDPRPLVPSLAALWHDEAQRHKTGSQSAELERAMRTSMSADLGVDPIEWLGEDGWRRRLDKLMETERQRSGTSSSDDILTTHALDMREVPTVLEAIATLFPNEESQLGSHCTQSPQATFGVTFNAAMSQTAHQTSFYVDLGQDLETDGSEDEGGGNDGGDAMLDDDGDVNVETNISGKGGTVPSGPEQSFSAIMASQHYIDPLSDDDDDDDQPDDNPADETSMSTAASQLDRSQLQLHRQALHRSFVHTDLGRSLMGSEQTSRLSRGPSLTQSGLLRQSSQRFEKDVAAAVGQHCQNGFVYMLQPPAFDFGGQPLTDYGLPEVVYPPTRCSNPPDVPTTGREFGGHSEHVVGTTTEWLPRFDPDPAAALDHDGQIRWPTASEAATIKQHFSEQRSRCSGTVTAWEFIPRPPSARDVAEWLAKDNPAPSRVRMDLSQIDGPTQNQRRGHGLGKSSGDGSKADECDDDNDLSDDLSTLSLEILCRTRGDLLPHPAEDPILAIGWAFQSRVFRGSIDNTDSESDDDSSPQSTGNNRSPSRTRTHQGVIVLDEGDDGRIGSTVARFGSPRGIAVRVEKTEVDLLFRLVSVVQQADPDILLGYDLVRASWGYLVDRAQAKFGIGLGPELGRVRADVDSHLAANTAQGTHGLIAGRHVINLWRAMRGELADQTSFTAENVAMQVLGRRIPSFTLPTLAGWMCGRPGEIHRASAHLAKRAKLNIEIADATDLIARTVEQARLVGIDFSAVYGRGSQFKVESLLFRLTKSENLLQVSPSSSEVAAQAALECVPLVMEPRSRLYRSPVVVLDFQSLYPSVVIAHNYCYSTCLGRLRPGPAPLGFTSFTRPDGLLERIGSERIAIAPNELMFVRPMVRRSIIARMLAEILQTRVMIKAAMAADAAQSSSPSSRSSAEADRLARMRHNRQLTLKLTANVVYGYTSASYSGRMPCAEIADAIVQTGRETVERAISLIENADRPGWAGAEVVYGDTDSIFVHLPGRSAASAKEIGLEMAAAVTAINPRPVKLQLDKVYHPAVLMAKKRYFGLKAPAGEWDAKGIESVRRDGTPASRKIVQAALTELLRSHGDLSGVRRYIVKQCSKLLAGRVPVSDLCFARTVHPERYTGLAGPLPPSFPPGLAVALRRAARDPRARPQDGERVPYVIVRRPGTLLDRAVDPAELLDPNSTVEIDAEYYIGHNIVPPLDRVLQLVGASATSWVESMRRPIRRSVMARPVGPLSAFFTPAHCVCCAAPVSTGPSHEPRLCADCSLPALAGTVVSILSDRIQAADIKSDALQAACRLCQCAAADGPTSFHDGCANTDCDLRFAAVRAQALRAQIVGTVGEVVNRLSQENATGG